MELIEGEDLNQHIERLGRRPEVLLPLLVQVCNAVNAAHQRGIVHRDLKPGNVLVDRSERVRIVDFGIVRAQDANLEVTAQATNFGQIIGTLAYMSPEQAGGASELVDRRSDVYAIGVLAHTLLAGEHPIPVSDSLAQTLKAIAEQEPRSLSRFGFNRDLSLVVAKTLEKDADRRYASAALLGAEFERVLQGEPVLARPPRAFDRLRRIHARNPSLVRAVGLLILALTLGIIGTGSGLLRARRAADDAQKAQHRAEDSQKKTALALEEARQAKEKAEDERTRATQAQKQTQAINEFLDGSFGAGNPSRQSRRFLYLHDYLLDAAERLERGELKIDEGAEAMLGQRLGLALATMGYVETSGRLLAQALKVRSRVDGEDSLAWAHAARAFALHCDHKQDFRTSESYYRRASAILRAHGRIVDAVSCEASRCGSLLNTGRVDEALALVAVLAKEEAPEVRDSAPIQEQLRRAEGITYKAMGRFQEAITALESARNYELKIIDPGHEQLVVTSLLLAECYMYAGRLDEALATASKAITTLEEDERNGRTPRFTANQGVYALILGRMGRIDEADAWLAKVQSNFERHAAPEQPKYWILRGRASLAALKGDDHAALALFQQAIDELEEHNAAGHPMLERTFADIAPHMMALGRVEEAEEAALRGLRAYDQVPVWDYGLSARNAARGNLSKPGPPRRGHRDRRRDRGYSPQSDSPG